MVATMGPAPKTLTLSVTGEDGRPYRGEAAAPPIGEPEAVRRIVNLDFSAAVEQVFQLAGSYPAFFDGEAVNEARFGVERVINRLLRIPNAKAKRQEVMLCYNELRNLLCQSALGMPTAWPSGFWETSVGQLLYISFYEAYGESLLLNQGVAKELHIDLSRVGQIERLGLLGYIENPYVAHRMQRRRRVSPDMVTEYRLTHLTSASA